MKFLLRKTQKPEAHGTVISLPTDTKHFKLALCNIWKSDCEGGLCKEGNMQIILERFPFLWTRGCQGIAVLPLKRSVINDTLKCYLFCFSPLQRDCLTLRKGFQREIISNKIRFFKLGVIFLCVLILLFLMLI